MIRFSLNINSFFLNLKSILISFFFKLSKIHDENYQKANSFNQQGINLRNKNKYEEAVDAFTKAIKLYPDNIIYLNNRGFALRKIGEYKRAIQDYTDALKKAPKNIKTLKGDTLMRKVGIIIWQ